MYNRALSHFNTDEKKVKKIILCKPIQESGEKLGFLPGDIADKIDPYMQSYISNFKKIEEDSHRIGVKCRMVFENGYGVSVVSHTHSYGGSKGLFEIAVLGKDGDLTYDTPVTNDVVGYLNPDEVTEIMEHVQSL